MRWHLQLSWIDDTDGVVWEPSSAPSTAEFYPLFLFLMAVEINQIAEAPGSVALPAEYRIYDAQDRVYHYWRPERGHWSELA